MKKSYKLASVTMLCSLFLLGACHKNEAKNGSSDYSVVKTTQSSSKKAKSAKTTKKSTAKASDSKSESNTKTASESTSSAPVQSSANQSSSSVANANNGNSTSSKTTSTVDINALASGNFSTISGTWSNDSGRSVTVSSNGQATFVDENREYALAANETSVGVFWGTIYPKDAQVGGAAFILIPAGIADPITGNVSNTDRILIGQDENANAHPFYRN